MLCKGCGACIEACPNSAISMRYGTAFINQEKCTSCEVCIEACPTGALQLLEEREPVLPMVPRSIEVLDPERNAVTPQGNSGSGARILSLVGQYLIPRMVDVLANFLEERISPTIQVQNATTRQTGTNFPYRRRRQRRGRMTSQNPPERR